MLRYCVSGQCKCSSEPPPGKAELLARIRAAVCRASAQSVAKLVIAGITIQPSHLKAIRGPHTVDLTSGGVALLKCFHQNEGKVLSRDESLDECWGSDCFPESRTLDQHISKLREKIEIDAENPRIIETVRGKGYRLSPCWRPEALWYPQCYLSPIGGDGEGFGLPVRSLRLVREPVAKRHRAIQKLRSLALTTHNSDHSKTCSPPSLGIKLAVMLLSLRFLACALLCHVFASACWAWADAGHKTIALIAWSQLSPETRASVVNLLERHPTFSKHFAEQMKAELGETPSMEVRQRWIFAQAAVWPDMVRPPLDGSPNKYAKYHHASWHYLDLPVFADAKSQAELADKMPKLYWNWKPGMPEFIEQKLTAAQALDKARHVVPDVQHQMDSDRVLMLCWMFHVTGDLHQPCHCSSLFAVKPFPKGDRGGNSILLKDPVVGNLHSFWDQLLGYKLSATDAQTIAESLLKEPGLIEKAKCGSAVLEPKAWVEEGSALAKIHVYTPAILEAVLKLEPHTYKKNNISYEAVGPLTLTAEQWKEYTTQAQALARQQAVTAGFRLAKLLEAAVAPAP